MNQFHDELLREGYHPFGRSGPAMSSHQVNRLQGQVPSAQYAGNAQHAPPSASQQAIQAQQVAQLAGALLSPAANGSSAVWGLR